MCACMYYGSGFLLRLVCVSHFLAGALYCGGTSMSVRMLREMTAEEVGRTLAFVCYIWADLVVVVGTEVPIMCL